MNNEQHDLLIARIVDGDASLADWSALMAVGQKDRDVWRRVIESQRDQARLEALVTHAHAAADRVVVPAAEIVDTPERTTQQAIADPDSSTEAAWTQRGRGRAARDRIGGRSPRGGDGSGNWSGSWGGWRSWTGWAVAAALIVAWSVSMALRVDSRQAPGTSRVVQNDGPQSPNRMESPSVAPAIPVSTQQAFDTYLERGRADGTVLGVVPRRVILETRPNPNGRGYEIICLQQIMERTVVPDLFQLQRQDEQAQPSLVRYEPESRTAM